MMLCQLHSTHDQSEEEMQEEDDAEDDAGLPGWGADAKILERRKQDLLLQKEMLPLMMATILQSWFR